MKIYKRDFFSKAIGQYFVFLLLAIPCLFILLISATYTVSSHRFFLATDLVKLPAILEFLFISLNFIGDNTFIILLVIVSSIIAFEIRYSKPNKSYLRILSLCIGLILIASYTMLFQFQIVCLFKRSLMHPKLKETIQQINDTKYNKTPNKENTMNGVPPSQI
jgi:hypothetical protein